MTITRYYLNNQPYMFDTDSGVFTPDDPTARPLTLKQVERAGNAVYVANLPVVDINGELYFQESRFRQYRRASAPFDVIPFDVFRASEEGGPHKLTLVGGKALSRHMAALRQRELVPEGEEEHADEWEAHGPF